MKAIVGSKNPSKIAAVREVLQHYKMFDGCSVLGVEVNSGIPEQPKSLEETIRGALNRAIAAFGASDGLNGYKYSFGLESGLMEVPHTKTGYMDVGVCAIYDGRKTHLGLGPCFEYPIKVTELCIHDGRDVNEATYLSGLTEDMKLGNSGGTISLLTKGRLVRKDLAKYAIMMALIHLENQGLYEK